MFEVINQMLVFFLFKDYSCFILRAATILINSMNVSWTLWQHETPQYKPAIYNILNA